MHINIIKRSTYKVSVDVTDDDGNILCQRLLNRFSTKDINWLATINPEWTRPYIHSILNELCENDINSEFPMDFGIDFDPTPETLEELSKVVGPPEEQLDEKTDQQPFVVHLRELNYLKSTAIPFQDFEPHDALKVAFEGAPRYFKEPLIEWFDKSKLCCLDVDYHAVPSSQRPSPHELSKILSKVRPQPYCWHPSHGGGAKLYYSGKPGYTADELASIAGLSWIQSDPRATFDLGKSSRHPCFRRSRDGAPPPCRSIDDIIYTEGSSDLSIIRKLLLSEVEHSDVEQWLSERGWHLGMMIPHSLCPLNPGDPSTDATKENVFIGERGLYCHRCASRGFGGATPGLVSYGQLIGGSDNRVSNMVKHFVHLEHAKIILSNIYKNVPSTILETVYRVLMKIVHGYDDPRINMAFTAGKGFVRTRGQWVSADGEHSLTGNIVHFVRSLPATLFPTEDGLKSVTSTVTAFHNSVDLSEYGYNDITFIRGCKIYGEFQSYKEENIKVVVRPEFRKSPPRYIPLHRRMPSEDAWMILESEFPGIDRNYVKLLLSAKGASEGRLAQCPYLLITGVSGAGKSTTVHIAAGICGDKAEEPIFVPHVDRFRQSLMDGARVSSFLCINEIFKHAAENRLTAVQALNPLLSLTEDSRSHVLYVGSVPFGRLPVFVLTDIDIPPEVMADVQISRRFTFYRLNQSNKWSDTFVKKNIRPHEFRLLSYDHNAAADSILSEVIDEFFQQPISLQEIAESLHISVKENYVEDVTSSDNTLVRFYEEVCKAPQLSGKDILLYKPQMGWKKIDRVMESPLNDAWKELCDSTDQVGWSSSRKIGATDWASVLKLPFAVMCDIRAKQNSVIYVRFRSCDGQRYPKWINGVEMNY